MPRIALAMLLLLPFLMGADGTGVDAMPPWIQAGSLTAFATLVYLEVRKIRDKVDTMLQRLERYAGGGRRLRTESDSPVEAGRGTRDGDQ